MYNLNSKKQGRKHFFEFLFIACLITATVALYADENNRPCKKMTIDDFPKADVLPDSDTADVKAGESREYYYGIGKPVDYKKARIAAFKEFAAGDELVIGGNTVLIMLYANGYGVKQDIDLALRLACGNLDDFSQGGIECQTEQLEKIKDGRQKEPFDICQSCGNTFFSGHCYAIQLDIANARRESVLRIIYEKLSEKKKAAFENISRTAEAYIVNRSNDNEVDTTGTGRSIWIMEEEGNLREEFTNAFVSFEKGKFPSYSKDEYDRLDKELNKSYQLIQGCKNFEYGSVTKESIKKVQRLWVKYKKAWAVNGPVLYPGVNEISWNGWMTSVRLEHLKYFIETAVEINSQEEKKE